MSAVAGAPQRRREPRVVLEPAPEPTMTQLLTGVVDDARLLVRQELELARGEIRLELERIRRGTLAVALAGALLLFAGGALVTALVLGLAAAGLAPWAAAALVAALLAVAGGLALRLGLRRVRTFDPVPRRAVDKLRRAG